MGSCVEPLCWWMIGAKPITPSGPAICAHVHRPGGVVSRGDLLRDLRDTAPWTPPALRLGRLWATRTATVKIVRLPLTAGTMFSMRPDMTAHGTPQTVQCRDDSEGIARKPARSSTAMRSHAKIVGRFPLFPWK